MLKLEEGVCVWIFQCLIVETKILLSNPLFPSYIRIGFLVGHKAAQHFPTSLTAMCGLMAKFWPMKCEWGCCVQFPNYGHKGRKYAFCFPFLFFFPLTSKNIVPWDGSCLLKMKGQQNRRSLDFWYLRNYHASQDQIPRLAHEREKITFWSSLYDLCSLLLSWTNI